jgi:hypothetical protein
VVVNPKFSSSISQARMPGLRFPVFSQGDHFWLTLWLRERERGDLNFYYLTQPLA